MKNKKRNRRSSVHVKSNLWLIINSCYRGNFCWKCTELFRIIEINFKGKMLWKVENHNSNGLHLYFAGNILINVLLI